MKKITIILVILMTALVMTVGMTGCASTDVLRTDLMVYIG